MIPTRVGMNRIAIMMAFHGICDPHTRGDEPAVEKRERPDTERDPHTRGDEPTAARMPMR